MEKNEQKPNNVFGTEISKSERVKYASWIAKN